MLKIFFDISTGFRFSKISVECSVHLCSCPWLNVPKVQKLKLSAEAKEANSMIQTNCRLDMGFLLPMKFFRRTATQRAKFAGKVHKPVHLEL